MLCLCLRVFVCDPLPLGFACWQFCDRICRAVLTAWIDTTRQVEHKCREAGPRVWCSRLLVPFACGVRLPWRGLGWHPCTQRSGGSAAAAVGASGSWPVCVLLLSGSWGVEHGYTRLLAASAVYNIRRYLHRFWVDPDLLLSQHTLLLPCHVHFYPTVCVHTPLLGVRSGRWVVTHQGTYTAAAAAPAAARWQGAFCLAGCTPLQVTLLHTRNP